MNKRRLIFIIALIIFILAVGFLVYDFFFMGKNNKTPEITLPEQIEVKEELPENPVNFEELKSQNSDVIGWINVPDTNINYPILQSTDSPEDFYLYHDINKNYLFAGCIYTQKMNSPYFDDPNTVIYGHNMRNGSMFANLHKFEKKEFFDAHENVYIYIPGHILTYKIFSAYVYDDRHILNSFNFNDPEVYAAYLETALNPHSIYANKREVKATNEDKIITLCTCTNYGDNRYLVQGVLIDDKQTK